MFASLKNKIREETGSDISKLTAKITSSTAQRIEALRGRSHQGSTSSINSVLSSEGNKEESASETGKQEEEYKRKVAKIETDFVNKLEEKSKEWQDVLGEKDNRIQTLEKEKDDALKQISNLKESLKYSEALQKKLVEHREDKEQIENFQTQELAKVKHLVLLREQELAEKTAALKESTQQLEKLRTEITRLRRQEERLSDVQQDVNVEIKAVRKNLDNTECQLEKTDDECSKLKLSVESEHQANNSLRLLITKLEKELNEEKTNSLNVQKTLSRVTSEKNSALLRNAEISQQMEISKQETRRQEIEMTELTNKITLLEEENKKYKEKESKNVELELKNSIAHLEEQLTEKNKNIKTLQLRLADMKKTLQQELRTPGSTNYYNDLSDTTCAAILTPSQTSTKNLQHSIRKDDDDINFKYLKHVLIKFLTSREYEAQHLIRAVSTLLKFSPEEEKLLQDTLDWKMSWFGVFGPKPKVGNGQLATNIPPS